MRTSLTIQPDSMAAPRVSNSSARIGAGRVAGVFEEFHERVPHSLVVVHDMDNAFAGQEPMPPQQSQTGRSAAEQRPKLPRSNGLLRWFFNSSPA